MHWAQVLDEEATLAAMQAQNAREQLDKALEAAQQVVDKAVELAVRDVLHRRRAWLLFTATGRVSRTTLHAQAPLPQVSHGVTRTKIIPHVLTPAGGANDIGLALTTYAKDKDIDVSPSRDRWRALVKVAGAYSTSTSSALQSIRARALLCRLWWRGAGGWAPCSAAC